MGTVSVGSRSGYTTPLSMELADRSTHPTIFQSPVKRDAGDLDGASEGNFGCTQISCFQISSYWINVKSTICTGSKFKFCVLRCRMSTKLFFPVSSAEQYWIWPKLYLDIAAKLGKFFVYVTLYTRKFPKSMN